jgi:hypothetical protein
VSVSFKIVTLPEVTVHRSNSKPVPATTSGRLTVVPAVTGVSDVGDDGHGTAELWAPGTGATSTVVV